MSGCPKRDGLVAAELAAHVERCETCAAAMQLARQRELAGGCDWFEDLLAVRDGLDPVDALALESHLAGCVACRAIATTIAPADAPRHAQLPTVSLGAYAFGREVARGGMGRIVAAQDLRIGRPVAVKELLGSSPATASRFEREARITARLQHPGIVPIYEIGAWPDGTPFYTMRLVEGQTLSAAIATAENRLSLLPAVIAAAEAVAFAHAHEVIHRDLKPSNIMVGAFGETVVIDWGLAKSLDEDDVRDAGPYRGLSRDDLTQIGEVMGTAAYMPPEQANAEPVDRRADVYALGAILYHLLAGAAPYQGATSLAIVELVRTASPAALPASAPRDLASIVAKAMARDPAARYADAGELVAELQRFQTGRLVVAHAYSRGERVRRWLRQYRLPVVAALALVVAGSIGFVGVLRERDVATAHEQKEHDVAVALLEEQGRQELLAGQPLRALAYFDNVLQQGLDSPELRFMLARALPSIEGRRATFECGDYVTAIATSDARLVAACGDGVRAWELGAKHEVFTAHVTHASAVDVLGDVVLALGDEAVLIGTDGAVRAHLGASAGRGVLVDGGRRAVVLAADGTATSWDASGRALVHYGAPTRARVLLAASRDGSVVALGAAGVVRLFDGATGASRGTVGEGAELTDLEISDDGASLIACGVDGSAAVHRGETTYSIARHRDAIHTCPISPDGTHAILTSLDMRNEVWDLRSGREIGAIGGYTDEARFSPDSKLIATGYHGITLYDASTVAQVARYERDATHEVRFGGGLAFLREGTSITGWTTQTAEQFSFMPPVGEMLFDANADASRALTQARDGSLALYDPSSGTRIATEAIRAVSFRDEDQPFPALFSGDGSRFAAWNGRDAVLVVDARSGATVGRAPAGERPRFQLDRRGERLLISEDSSPRVWSVAAAAPIGALPGVHAEGLSPDGTRVVVWTEPEHAQVWDVDAGRAVGGFVAHGELHIWGYDRDLTRVVACEICPQAHNGTYLLFDVASGRRVLETPGSVAAWFSRDRDEVTIPFHERISIWRLKEGDERRVMPARPFGAINLWGDATLAEVPGIDYARIISLRDDRDLWHFDVLMSTSGTRATAAVMPERVSRNGDLLVMEGHLSAWRFTSETRSAAAIHAIIAGQVPWVVRDGRLYFSHAKLSGRVLRGGQPVANAIVTATNVDERSAIRRSSYTVRSRADGGFSFTDLTIGTYEVGAGGAATRVDATHDRESVVEVVAP